jgi:hypothetical protein
MKQERAKQRVRGSKKPPEQQPAQKFATLKDWLLAPEPKFDLKLRRIRGARMRPVKFD